MTGRVQFAVALAVLFSQTALAQARVVSVPPEPSLLSITRDWSRASTLGDLRELRTGSDYVELRVWGGYGFGMTQGVVLRRAGGRWSAFLARVRRCAIQIPIAVGDTASAATMRRYVAETRRQCDTPLGDVAAGMRIITADTLAVDALAVPDSVIDRAWTAAVRAGVLQLPGRVKHTGTRSTDFTYVVELRRGDEYRASELEHLEQPETEVDRQIKEVYAAVSRVLPPELVVKPGPPGASMEHVLRMSYEDS
ncbi:MAG TPA: hypothetical protein VLN49_00015 [Gemmatimonadaceae bacterium]|nr:hypothetical protein [Gemmatimonadaceae bacterium]